MTTLPSGASPSAVARAARGLTGAMMRWHPARLSQDADEVLIACTEVLWWMTALDDLLNTDRDGAVVATPTSEYLATALLGLRHARNRLGHRLAEAIEVTPGFVFPISFPMTMHELVWVSRSRIDSFGGRPGKPAGDAYESALAGRPVRLLLDDAAAWLNQRGEQV